MHEPILLLKFFLYLIFKCSIDDYSLDRKKIYGFFAAGYSYLQTNIISYSYFHIVKIKKPEWALPTPA